MGKKLNILLFPHSADQSIPLRTEIAEIFGNYFSKKHNIIAIFKSKSKKQHFFWKRIEFYYFPLIKFIRKTFQLANSQKIDVIYLRNNLFLLLISYFLKKIYKIRVITHITYLPKFLTEIYHKWYHPRSLGGIIFNVLMLKFLRNIDLVLPTSEWMRKYLIANGIAPKKLYNFPNGSNPSLFKTTEYPTFIKNPTFVYIGTMDKIRRLEILIYAMKNFTEEFEDGHLFMVGKGNSLEMLKKLTKELGLIKNITFSGQVPYELVPKFVVKSHIALCPIPPYYLYKLSCPLKLFEYMCCSRPVIANREIPAHVKTIKESKCGLLVDYDPESFSKAMIKLFKNSKESEQMGINGSNWIKKNRTYEKLALDLEKKLLTTSFK